jgi:GT2 family glycosyltransferase
MCEAFAAMHPNVRVIRQPVRLGWLGNANALLRAAEGDYAFFAFHDDPLRPTYVEKLVAKLEENPQAVVAFSDFMTNKGPRSYVLLDDASGRFERCRKIFHAMGAWWSPNRGLMRMSAVKKLGGMRRNLAGEYAADLPWLLRLATLGEFVRVPEMLLHKNLHEKSLSASWRDNFWNNAAVKLACIRIIREAHFTPAQEFYLYGESLLMTLGISCPPALRKTKEQLQGWLSRRNRSTA